MWVSMLVGSAAYSTDRVVSPGDDTRAVGDSGIWGSIY